MILTGCMLMLVRRRVSGSRQVIRQAVDSTRSSAKQTERSVRVSPGGIRLREGTSAPMRSALYAEEVRAALTPYARQLLREARGLAARTEPESTKRDQTAIKEIMAGSRSRSAPGCVGGKRFEERCPDSPGDKRASAGDDRVEARRSAADAQATMREGEPSHEHLDLDPRSTRRRKPACLGRAAIDGPDRRRCVVLDREARRSRRLPLRFSASCRRWRRCLPREVPPRTARSLGS